MRLVLITRDGPEHRYVANQLDDVVGLAAVVIDDGRPLTRAERLRQLRRRYTYPQLASRAARSLLLRALRDRGAYDDQLRRVLGPKSQSFGDVADMERVAGINTEHGIDLVSGLSPDRLLVYGTGIIGPSVLSLSPSPPLNMHTGISPYYRGSSCAFWPLYNRELDMLGATVHEVTADVDGGRIYGVAEAEPEPDDGVHAVFARCVKTGASLYCDVLGGLESGTLTPVVQDLSLGREYKAVMRGPWAEIRVRWAIRQGLVRDFCARQDG